MGRWHACFAQHLGAEIVAVVDHNFAAANDLAKPHGAAVFSELSALLASQHPDVTHICTPSPSHLPLAMQAIAAGVHVLVEKPLTATLAQTQTLLTSAAANKVQVCPVHQFGFQRGVAKAAVEIGNLGQVLHANFTFCSAGGGAQTGIALDAIVGEILPHPLSILQVLWPDRILAAQDWSAVSQRHGELHARGSIGDIAASLYVSMHARPTRCEAEIFCSQGSIYLNLFHGYAVVRRGQPSRADKIAQPFIFAGKSFALAAANLAGRALRREGAYPGLSELIARFYAAVQGRGDAPILAAQSLAVASVRDHLIAQTLPDTLMVKPI